MWLLVLLALLAWWLLPRWAPNFVIRYSPMPDMVFRAAIDGNGASQTAEARLIAMGRDATEVMIAQLHHANELACALALSVLRGTKDLRATDAVIAVLNDPRDSLRSRAIDVLRDFGDPKAIPHLVSLLHSRALALHASVALMALPDTAVADALRPSLEQRTETWSLWVLNKNLDPRVPVWLDAEMRRESTDAYIITNTPNPKSDYADVKPTIWQESAANALGLNPQPACRSLLMEAMTDDSAAVRKHAAQGLIYGLQLPLSTSECEVVSQLLSDADAEVVEAAARLCNARGLSAAAPTLLRLLDSPDPAIRHAATYGYGINLMDVPGTTTLSTLVTDADENVRLGAASALGRIAGKQPREAPVVQPLIRALADRSPRVRKAAAASLGACHDDPQATAALVATLDDDHHLVARTAYETWVNLDHPRLTDEQSEKFERMRNLRKAGLAPFDRADAE